MRDAVIHPEKRGVEGEGEGPRRGRDGAKAWAQPRALRERDQVEVLKIHPRNVGRFPDQRHDHLRVVIRGLSRMDPSLLGPDHVVDVREHAALLVHDAHADRVGGAFDPQGAQSNP